MTPSYTRVIGEFYAQQTVQGEEVPLSGTVTFTPRTNARAQSRLYGATQCTGYVVAGTLCEDPTGTRPGVNLLAPSAGIEPTRWSWHVVANLRDPNGNPARWAPFDVLATPGTDLDLINSAPTPAPITGDWSETGALQAHINAAHPHPAYDQQIPDLALLLTSRLI